MSEQDARAARGVLNRRAEGLTKLYCGYYRRLGEKMREKDAQDELERLARNHPRQFLEMVNFLDGQAPAKT